MKLTKPYFISRAILALTLALLGVSFASAQTNYYWDSNDGTAGFGTTAATWTATTLGTATAGWSTDATGATAISGNSVTTTTDDTVYFGTKTNDFPGAITFSGPLSAKYIYAGPVHGNFAAASSPVITFADDGIFETARDGTFGLPAVTIAGASNSMTFRSVRTLQLFNVTNTIPNTSKIILQTSSDTPFPYPGRISVNNAAQLGAVGTGLVFDHGTLLFATALPYTSLSALNADHPVTFTLNKDAGFNNSVASSTFTVDMVLNLGTGKFWSDSANGIIKLTQPNTMGGTHLTSSILEIDDPSQLGATTSPLIFGSGTPALANGTLRIAGTSMTSLGARPLLTTPAKGVAFDIADAANVFNLDKVLTQEASGGTFTKSGAGILILSGNNSYGGATTVSGGTLKLGHTNALGFGGVMTAAIAGTTVSAGATLDLNGMAGINEPITLNGTGIGANGALINSSVTPASIGSGISQATMTAAGSGLSAPPAVAISGPGSGATATASLGLTAASFTVDVLGDKVYTALPTVTITGGGGTGATATAVTNASGQVIGLTITAAGFGYTSAPTAIVSRGTSTVGTTTTTFTGNAANFCVGGLAMTSAGSGYSSSNTTTFTITGVSASVTNIFSAVTLAANSSIGGTGDITLDAPVQQNAAGRTLTKIGVNTLTLNGTNFYTGITTNSAGTLLVNGSLRSVVTNLSGATFGGTGSVTNVGFASGSFALFTNGATLTITGNLTLNNTTVKLNLANNVPAGTYTLATYSGSSSGGVNPAFVINNSGSLAAGTTGYVTNDTTAKQIQLVVVSAISEPVPATLTNSVSGSTLTLTWPAGEGWVLKNQTNSLSTGLNPDTNAWFTVPGGVDGSNSIPIDPNQPTVFYRLFYP